MATWRSHADGGRPPIRRTGRALLPRVSVWAVPLNLDAACLAEADSFLNQAERARAERGTPTVRRRRIALRAGLRVVAGRLLRCSPAAVRLGVSASGRPRLDGPGPDIDVSCSARGDLGLVAVADGLRIGVDVEAVSSWGPDVVAEGWLTPREVAAVQMLPPERRAEESTRLWTRKESILKAVGCGIAGDPGLVDVVAGGSARVVGWVLTPVRVPDGLVATLATSASVVRRGRTLVPYALPATWPILDDERRAAWP